jgi:anti-anti-sigma factor
MISGGSVSDGASPGGADLSRFMTFEVARGILFVTMQLEKMDMYNSSGFLEKTDRAFIALEFSNVIVDIRKIQQLDSTAIGALMVSIGRLRERRKGASLVLVSDRSHHHRVLQMVGSNVPVYRTIEEAERSLREP